MNVGSMQTPKQAHPESSGRLHRPTVLHVITDSFSAHAFVKPLAVYLADRGWHSVIACSPRSYADAHSFTSQMRSEGFDVRDVDLPRNIRPIADAHQIAAVCQLMRQEKPWLAHTHLAKAGVIGRIAARLVGIPCVHTVYDFAFVDHGGLRRATYLGLERLSAPLARRILFVSDNERRAGLKAGVGKPEQLITIGFGIDTGAYDPADITSAEVADVKRRYGVPEGRLVIGTVARLIHRKGIDILLEAVAVVFKHRFNCHLLVAGGGPLYSDLVAKAVRLGLADRVSFTGFVPRQRDMPSIFAAMDVFCLPSRREGYGMVYAEAGAMAKPVVASDMPPVNSIVVDGKTGILVRPEDAGALADALEQLLVDDARRAAMGQQARRFVLEHCDFKNAWAHVEDVYVELLEGSANRSA